MSIDWSKVLKKHIEEACSLHDTGDNCPTHQARNTFLIHNDKRYSAKFIRGLAYKIATGDKLSSNDYSGGQETVRFLSALGFSVEYNGIITDGVHEHTPDQETTAKTPIVQKSINPKLDTAAETENGPSEKTQKDFLIELLKQRFGYVVTEAKFDWLKVPDRVSKDGVLDGIYENLASIRGHKDFSTSDYKLACDYFIPSRNLIIEYDERQHFTIQRAESLAHYPSDLNIGFDKDKWCKACETIKATDNDPICRDEQRAFYDSVRDILAARNGMTLIRIKYGDYDWNSEAGAEVLNKLIISLKLDAYPSDIEEAIEELAWDFSCVQKTYLDWTKQFKTHEDVICWLKDHNIGERPKQNKLNLRCSHWNPITISVLYVLVPDCIAHMKEQFNKLFKNLSDDQIYDEQIWYLLYFLHPVRHETYFFDIHYPDGYAQHLSGLIRSHRLGLKSANTYLSNEEDRTINGSHISACGTVAFKHLHIHPTTSEWGEPNLNNLTKASILDLNLKDGGISSEEQKAAIAISARATTSFEKWLGYAPCAINEGPIFTLKKGKKHLDCFKAIVEILNGPDQKQDTMRSTLEEFYEIKITSTPCV